MSTSGDDADFRWSSVEQSAMAATPATRSSHEESMSLLVNAKLPLVFDGRGSWFPYEEGVDDWLSIKGPDNPTYQACKN